jgi:uncharacterized protein (DUF2235 family)
MNKNIVLCFDGTWNGPDVKATDGSYTPTNVQHVFESLAGSTALAPEDNEKEVSADGQVAKYIHGVGNTDNTLVQLSEGSTGLGLVSRIIRGYTYASRVYEPGDKLFIIGFSRGAYTARALAGFIIRQGLLDWNAMKLTSGSEASYSAGLIAWDRYKRALHQGNMSLLNKVAQSFCTLHDKLEATLHPAPPLKFINGIGIEAVGVWETVGALGIPDLIVKEERLDEFQFADNVLNAYVANGFHAVAVDEQRVDFSPSLWQPRDGVVQVLFPGAHADVGGGYSPKEAGLAYSALLWMIRQIAGVGILFDTKPAVTANPLDIQHRPWRDSGLYKGRTQARHFPPGLSVSQRILERAAAQKVPVEGALKESPYRPANLLNSYLLLDGCTPAPHVQVLG